MQPIAAYINRVIHGDCIEVMRAMPAGSVDCIITDPPYIVRYASRDGRTIAEDDNGRWLAPAFTEAFRVLKSDRYAVSFYGWSQVHRFMEAWRGAGFVPVSHLVFVKDYASKTGFTGSYHECAYVLAKGFCQVVEAEMLIRQAGASPRFCPPFRQPAPCLSLRPNSRIASASLDDSRPLTTDAVAVESVG